MKWRRRWYRLRAKLRAALRGWKNPHGSALPHAERSADWSREVNFTRNQSVLRIFLPVDNELFHRSRPGPEHVTNIVVNEVADLARRSTRDYFNANYA